MKILLLLAVVMATAYCAPTTQTQQRQRRMTLAEAQQLREVLTDLFRKSSAVNIQDVPAEMQGFWSSFKRGLGHALKLAHKGVHLYTKHVAPHVGRILQGQEGEREQGIVPIEEPVRSQQIDEDFNARLEQMDDDYARFEQYGDDYAQSEQYGEEDYTLEQLMAALQEYDGEGLSKEAKAQFDFGRLLGGIKGLFG